MLRSVAGFILLGFNVVLWVGSSTLIQTIMTNENFNKPFFLTYFSTSIFCLYFVDVFRRRKDIRSGKLPGMKITFKIAAKFTLLWFIANYFYNLSLVYTSIASSNIISSTSTVSTFLLSILLIKAKPDVLKFIAVFFSFGGSAMIGIVGASYSGQTIEGDIFAFIGAVVYGLYCIFITITGDKVDLVHMFAFVGIINFIGLMPMFLVLNYTGFETFEFPSGKILGFLFLNAIFGTVLSSLTWGYSVKLLNPTLATVGTALTIPLSMIVDFILHGYTYSWLYFVGSALVVLGFIIMSLFEHPEYAKAFSNEGLKNRCCKGNNEVRDENISVPIVR